jgi:hypothetical protein
MLLPEVLGRARQHLGERFYEAVCEVRHGKIARQGGEKEKKCEQGKEEVIGEFGGPPEAVVVPNFVYHPARELLRTEVTPMQDLWEVRRTHSRAFGPMTCRAFSSGWYGIAVNHAHEGACQSRRDVFPQVGSRHRRVSRAYADLCLFIMAQASCHHLSLLICSICASACVRSSCFR